MTSLPYGYELPQNPDTGDVFWPALEENFTQLASHNHDGTNSAPLASKTLSALAANWVSSGGQYRQLLTLPTGFSYDTTWLCARNTATGEQEYVKFVKFAKVTSTTFYIYSSDNTVSFTVLVR